MKPLLSDAYIRLISIRLKGPYERMISVLKFIGLLDKEK